LEQAWAARNGGASIWADKTVTFLDPFTKSGVFLREIAKRLIAGLEAEIPDLQERVDHILTKQVFGIATTRITALLARRSLYCSKHATGPHSVARGFGDNDDGNIWFERMEHVPEGDRCRYCGATGELLKRGVHEENYAYAFIHTADIKVRVSELFGGKMQFDVIIGNPPYQLNTEGHGTQARPIYQDFVEQAKALEPRFLSMIIPARWFSGGMGLDDFREAMLSDDRVRVIEDYLTASDVFPGVGLKGGVCYFLWDRENRGTCRVSTHYNNLNSNVTERRLLEEGLDVFVRFNEGVSILQKVAKYEGSPEGSLMVPQDKRFIDLVSSIGAFGLDTKFRGKDVGLNDDLAVYRNGGIGYIEREKVSRETHVFDKWKVFVGAAAPGTGNKDTYPHKILSTPFIGKPGTISSWTYNYIGPFDTERQAKSAISYLTCRFTRFLILLHKPSQHTNRKVYTFVPKQTWDRDWTDAELYAKYGLSDDEILFIEKLVRPMDPRVD
jgi:site-specific DNA-methyltransferase (adenine-specific)